MNATTNSDELSNFVKSLADSERLKIAGLLGVEALTMDEASERLGMKPIRVAHHLEVLMATRLIHKEGNTYKLDSQAFEILTRKVLAQSHPPPPEFEGDEFEVKTLRAYISRDGTLKSIPSQQKKLVVILTYIAKDFEPGVKFPEVQVNKILGRYHDDYAALRRYMVDNGLLQREKGSYWRIEGRG
jgi:hypothetical protein